MTPGAPERAGLKVVEKWQAQGGPYLPRDLTEQQKAELASYIDQGVAQAVQAERERWNCTKPIDAPPVCSGCGGPHPFDTSIPSVVWNRVIRDGGLPDYLCTTCIIRAFALAGVSFTATLWSPEFHGLPIHVMVRDHVATDAAAISEENTQLRADLFALRARPTEPTGEQE